MSDPLPLSALSQRVIARPGLQMPGRDPCVAERDIGGPEDPTDRRLILDTATLRAMLAEAESSISGRVVIHGIGLRVRQHRANTGHLYEVVYLLGRAPVAEGSAILAAAQSGTLPLPNLSGG